MESAWDRFLTKNAGKLLIEFRRDPKIKDKITGFIDSHSDSFILLHHFDWDPFILHGYTIIRDEDIVAYRLFSRSSYWQTRAIQKFHIYPTPAKKISLKNWSEIMFGILQHFPLVTIHREIASPDVCHIGVPVQITAKTLVLDALDSTCEWAGTRRFKLDSITRVDFGGGYETALAATAKKRTRKSTVNPKKYNETDP